MPVDTDVDAKTDWHSQEQFVARMRERREHPRIPTPLTVWYHVACMGNWRDVLYEQVEVFQDVGLSPRACVLGLPADIEHVKKFMPVAYSSPDWLEYETPTLQLLWEWCTSNQDGAVLYVHTKGVSNPADANKAAWRKLMMQHVVCPWEGNLKSLEVADLVGIDWQDSPNYPHFSGNFWMARADWVSHLCSPDEYRTSGGPPIAGHPWERMHAEMWIGSKQWHHIENLCCRNENLWAGNRVFQLLAM